MRSAPHGPRLQSTAQTATRNTSWTSPHRRLGADRGARPVRPPGRGCRVPTGWCGVPFWSRRRDVWWWGDRVAHGVAGGVLRCVGGVGPVTVWCAVRCRVPPQFRVGVLPGWFLRWGGWWWSALWASWLTTGGAPPPRGLPVACRWRGVDCAAHCAGGFAGNCPSRDPAPRQHRPTATRTRRAPTSNPETTVTITANTPTRRALQGARQRPSTCA